MREKIGDFIYRHWKGIIIAAISGWVLFSLVYIYSYLGFVYAGNSEIITVREELCINGYTVKYADIDCKCEGWVKIKPEDTYIVIGTSKELYSFDFWYIFYHEECHIRFNSSYEKKSMFGKVSEEFACVMYGVANAAFNKAEFC